jgi:pimeloyl-ACP methyl ester carboxylesterase
MGFAVAVALAANHSELVDRLVNIGEAPDSSYGDVPLLAKLGYVPVLGEAIWRLTPDFAVKDGYSDAFAPGFDIDAGFDDADQVVEDFNAMTYTSFDRSAAENDSYADEESLPRRAAATSVPLLAIFGTEDQIQKDPEASADAYRSVPGAEVEMVADAGHSPNVEKPEETAALIQRFAAESHYEPPTAHHRRKGGGSGSGQAKHHQHKSDRHSDQHRRGSHRHRKHGGRG